MSVDVGIVEEEQAYSLISNESPKEIFLIPPIKREGSHSLTLLKYKLSTGRYSSGLYGAAMGFGVGRGLRVRFEPLREETSPLELRPESRPFDKASLCARWPFPLEPRRGARLRGIKAAGRPNLENKRKRSLQVWRKSAIISS